MSEIQPVEQLTATVGRREKKKQATRMMIIESASSLFSQHGFDGTSIDEICEKADVVKGTFYYHFASKEDLVVELRRDRMRQQEEQVTSALAAGVSPLKVLHDLFVRDAEWSEANEELSVVFISQIYMRRAQSMKNRDENDTPKPGSVRSPIYMVVEAAQKSGELRSDVSAQIVSEIIFGNFIHCKRTWLGLRDRGSLVDMIQTWSNLVLEGLRPTR